MKSVVLTFLTFFSSEAKELLQVMEKDFLQRLGDIEVEGKKLEPPKRLPW